MRFRLLSDFYARISLLVPCAGLRTIALWLQKVTHACFGTAICISVPLFLLCLCSPAIAHPRDEAGIYHFFKCDLTHKGLTLDYRLLVGGLSVYKVWDTLDTDRDKTLSEEEKQAFARRTHAALRATLDSRPVTLTPVLCDVPRYEAFIAGTIPYLTLIYRVTYPASRTSAFSFDFTTHAFPTFTSHYMRPVLEGPASSHAQASIIADQKGFTLRLARSEQARAEEMLPYARQDTDRPPVPDPDFPTKEDAPASSHALQMLHPYLGERGGIWIALGLAFLLGMGHALLPGHSKTVVGAYLIGARGTLSDALLLGSIVTLAHTGVVLLFGLLMWRFERFMPERMQPYVQMISGLLVAVIGLSLLLRALLHCRTASQDAVAASECDFVPRPGVTKRDLILLGLSGGMVPCADALILLLFAHAQQKTALGLLLVLVFAAGMASVLIGIGLMMVKAGSAVTKKWDKSAGRFLRAAPVVSAAVILVLGLWLTGTAWVQALQRGY